MNKKIKIKTTEDFRKVAKPILKLMKKEFGKGDSTISLEYLEDNIFLNIEMEKREGFEDDVEFELFYKIVRKIDKIVDCEFACGSYSGWKNSKYEYEKRYATELNMSFLVN